jgi:adenosylcobinamide kinase/adenosylcobinamide-phosphate guanylyltransferase
MSRPLVVILGGTRSGKSRFGRDRAAALAGAGPVTFVATALPGDAEMDERIAMHRADRPAGWATIEPARELPAAIRAVSGETTILIDGLTLWLSQLVEDAPDVPALVDGPVEELRGALSAHDGPVVLVSDEIGLGLVPVNALSRAFRDLLGIAHQRLVADSDEAWFMVAGRAIRLVEPVTAGR